MSIPLRICIVEPTPVIGKNLVRDLRRLEIATEEDILFLHKFSGADVFLHQHKPHVVFLSLDMPNDGAFRLLQRFPTEQRPFIVILLSNPELDKYIRPSLLSELYGAGYLVKGVFSNEELIKVVERVRKEVQKKLVEDFKAELLEAVTHFSVPSLPEETATTFSRRELSEAQAEQEETEKNTPREEVFFVTTVTKNNEKVKVEIPWEWVIYTESAGNYVNIHYFADGNLPEIVGKKAALEHHNVSIVRSNKIVIPSSFIQPHRSYWVQKKFILSVSSTAIYMITGKRISLSQNNRERIIETLEGESKQFTISNEFLRTLHAAQKDAKEKGITHKANSTNAGGGHKSIPNNVAHAPLC